MRLAAAALVPGLPHILHPEWNDGYGRLAAAASALGDRFAALGVKRVIYYSTQWVSVLGHLYQAKASLQGLHVDENWYDLGDIPFQMQVDTAFAKRLAAVAAAQDFQTRLVDYDGFPVDTGTLVADHLINKDRFSVGMVSCCVYSDYADTVRLAQTVAAAISDDEVPTAVVAVSALSQRFFTTSIDLREDHISSVADDRWNRRLLTLLTKGQYHEIEHALPDYASTCKVDMGGKALAFLHGAGVLREGRGALVKAYGAIYGTGAAVIEW